MKVDRPNKTNKKRKNVKEVKHDWNKLPDLLSQEKNCVLKRKKRKSWCWTIRFVHKPMKQLFHLILIVFSLITHHPALRTKNKGEKIHFLLSPFTCRVSSPAFSRIHVHDYTTLHSGLLYYCTYYPCCFKSYSSLSQFLYLLRHEMDSSA